MKKIILPLALLFALTVAACDVLSSDDEPSIRGYEITSSATIVDVKNPQPRFTLRLTTADTMLTWELRESVDEYTFGFVPAGGTLSITAWGGGTVDEVSLK